MSSTYLNLHYHIVFATKGRVSLIDTSWRSRLHEYLGGTIQGLEGFPEGIGGIADHVHILARLKATHCLAEIMRELKKSSSTWIHKEIGERNFAWQEGYAAFTVSSNSIDAVRKYIAGQEEHHRIRSSQEELLEMLRKAGIEYNPKYLD